MIGPEPEPWRTAYALSEMRKLPICWVELETVAFVTSDVNTGWP